MARKGNRRNPGKAYFNERFLGSAAARPIRILSEYLEPLSRLQRKQVRDTIVFFGSARAKPLAEVDRLHKQALAERKRLGKKAPKSLKERLQRIEWDRSLAHYYEHAHELSRMLSTWAKSLPSGNRFIICSGGGPGIMEASNRGATEGAGALSMGLTISLPAEEKPNQFISPDLCFQFHYFFMRKLWFLYMAAALVIFPGGFGTMDELFEVLTLMQTRKTSRPIPIVLFGSRFWREVINFEALVRWGTIARKDLDLYRTCDSPQEAFDFLKGALLRHYRRPVKGLALAKAGLH